MGHLCNGNHQAPVTEMQGATNAKMSPAPRLKELVLPQKGIHRFTAIYIKMPVMLFTELEEKTPKLSLWNH